MEDSLAETSSCLSTPMVPGAQPVVVLNLLGVTFPWDALRTAMLFVAVTCMIVLLAPIVGWSVLAISGADDIWLFAGGLLLASALLVEPLGKYIQWRYARAHVWGVLEESPIRELRGDVGALLCKYGGLVKRPIFGPVSPQLAAQFQNDLRGLGHPCNLTIIDANLIRRLDSMERPGDFVEEEPIGSRPLFRPLRDAILIASLVGGAIFVFGPALVSFNVLAWFVVITGAWLVGRPILRSIAPRLGEDIVPVAGMGVVSDFKGRKWTVNDSCMLVRVQDLNTIVEFIGPQGYLCMKYSNGDDNGLRTLWQRWMHPHPRPDLVQ